MRRREKQVLLAGGLYVVCYGLAMVVGKSAWLAGVWAVDCLALMILLARLLWENKER